MLLIPSIAPLNNGPNVSLNHPPTAEKMPFTTSHFSEKKSFSASKTALMTSIWNLNTSTNTANISLIFSHKLIHASLNQSHLFHSTANIAISAPIPAIIIPIGFAVIATLIATIAVSSVGNIVIIVPTVDTTLPITINSGPIAATTPAIFKMVCFCDSVKPLNHDVNDFNFSVSFINAGCTVFNIVAPSCAPANFKLLNAILAWSGGSSVDSNVSVTTPL